MTEIETATVPSPVGTLHLYARGGRLVALDFDDRAGEARRRLAARFGPLREARGRDPAGAASALARYLDGELEALAAIPIDAGGTPFQARVWAALRRIPAGVTSSYREVARAVGSPGAVRAVGTANGRNAVALVIPCHRVIASDGGLAGYAGGLPRKRWLLDHEARSSR
jgi:methylated-DNA-[protein]-cysteine S-methyltransferase